MIKKRLFALALATVMTVSTSVVAFAEDTTQAVNYSANAKAYSAQEIEVTTTVEQPQIKVTVPTSGEFIINPYGLEAGSDSSTSAIVSPEYEIKSESDVPVTVNVTATTKINTPAVGSAMTLATANVTATSTKKEALIYLAFTPDTMNEKVKADLTADSTGIISGQTIAADTTIYAVDKSLLTANASKTGTSDAMVLSDAAKKVLAETGITGLTTTTKTATGKDSNNASVSYTLVTYKFAGANDYEKLDNQLALTGSTTGSSVSKTGVATLAKESGSVKYQFQGNASTNPSEAWQADDGVTVTLKFTFTPQVVPATAD
jgi:hypothetical protein